MDNLLFLTMAPSWEMKQGFRTKFLFVVTKDLFYTGQSKGAVKQMVLGVVFRPRAKVIAPMIKGLFKFLLIEKVCTGWSYLPL